MVEIISSVPLRSSRNKVFTAAGVDVLGRDHASFEEVAFLFELALVVPRGVGKPCAFRLVHEGSLIRKTVRPRTTC